MTDAKREAPVSFRPGKLDPAIRQRTRGVFPDGQVVKRDLGRYYLLLGQALRDVNLTKREAVWIATTQMNQSIEEHLSGYPFAPEHVNPSDQLRMLAMRAATPSNGREPDAFTLKMRDKIEAMSSLERAAVIDALDRLPIESEEDAWTAAVWELIGFPFAAETSEGNS